MKTQFLKFHKSKRNKLKFFCYNLLNTSENIHSQAKSLLFSWKNLHFKRKIEYFSKILTFSVKISNFQINSQKKLLRNAFLRVFSFKKQSKNSAILLRNCLIKKIRGYFSIFRVKQASSQAKSQISLFWSLSFSLEKIIKTRKTRYYNDFKQKIIRNWGFRFQKCCFLFEKYQRKLQYFAYKRLLDNYLRKSLKNKENARNQEKFVEILSHFLLKKKLNAFLKIKLSNFKMNLRKILRIYHQKLRNSLRNSFFKWRGNVIVKKIARKNLTNKVKGKILLSFSRNESNLSLKTSFLRWKVKSNKNLIKNTMDRLFLL